MTLNHMDIKTMLIRTAILVFFISTNIVSVSANASELQLDMQMEPAIQMDMSHGSMDATHDHAKHQHALIDVSEYEKIPSLSIEVVKDQSSGWNLHILTENFVFTPANVNQDNIAGEGHAHLYIDGQKVSRIYGDWFHFGKLSIGKHQVRVALNANDHSGLSVGDQPIEALVTIAEN